MQSRTRTHGKPPAKICTGTANFCVFGEPLKRPKPTAAIAAEVYCIRTPAARAFFFVCVSPPASDTELTLSSVRDRRAYAVFFVKANFVVRRRCADPRTQYMSYRRNTAKKYGGSFTLPPYRRNSYFFAGESLTSSTIAISAPSPRL